MDHKTGAMPTRRADGTPTTGGFGMRHPRGNASDGLMRMIFKGTDLARGLRECAAKARGLTAAAAWRLYPPTCVLCGGSGLPGRDLCAVCRDDLPYNEPACETCARPIALAGVCGACQRRPPPFDAALAALRYAPPVDWLVRRFKFDGRLSCGVALAELMAGAIMEAGLELPGAIVPVPLHRARLRSRGFDQARELARVLSGRLETPARDDLLRRIRPTAEQSGLDAAKRHGNVRRAFQLAKHPPAHVALVDDVMTTTSTAAECARELKRAGCERVQVWVAARA